MDKNMVKLTCAGCGVEFELSKNRYDAARRWGQSNFYHSPQCSRSRKTLPWSHGKKAQQ